MPPYTPATGTVTVFTTPWCGYCRTLKSGLDSSGVSFREVDIEQEAEALDVVTRVNGGNRTVPTVVFPDGSAATNPSVREVQRRLG